MSFENYFPLWNDLNTAQKKLISDIWEMADFSAFYWSRHEIAPFSLFLYNSPIKGICQLFD